jgi:hypothetical protein
MAPHETPRSKLKGNHLIEVHLEESPWIDLTARGKMSQPSVLQGLDR